MLEITPAAPATIAFVVHCLKKGAINAEEVREWAEEVLVRTGGDCPIYVEGLTVFDGGPEELLRMIAFTPEREFSAAEEAGLEALAEFRGRGEEGERSVDELEGRYPGTLEEFRGTFPFATLK